MDSNFLVLLIIFWFFVYLCFISQTFTIHRTVGEVGGYFLTPLYHFHPLSYAPLNLKIIFWFSKKTLTIIIFQPQFHTLIYFKKIFSLKI